MKANNIIQALSKRQFRADGSTKDNLRMMARNLPIMAWISEPDAPANWFNPEWLDFVGRTEKTIQNWAYQDFHHPDYMAEAVRKRFEATNAGKIWEDVFPLLGRDKKFHWLLSRAVPILNEEGKIECYFGFHMDVSDKIKHPPLRPAKW